jgi:glycosyltransferase involved in cell wall biosynthesis
MALKVLHLIDSGGLYGAEKMLLALVAEQLRLGLKPLILSTGAPDIEEKAIESEARRLDLPFIPWRMKPGFNPWGCLSIIQWAKTEGFDLFHSHGYKFNVLMGLWPEAVRKIPLITTLHGYVKAPRFSKSWVYECLDRFVLRQMRCVVLVAEAMKKDIPARLAGSDRVTVIPNGLDTARLVNTAKEPLEARLESFINTHSPVLLGVGRLSYEKGFDRLITAFGTVKCQHPGAGLVVIGEGRQRENIERQIRESELVNSVYLPGYYSNVPALMARADLLCMPSRTEGLPITLLEAMAVGLPVCASDVGEIKTVLEGGKAGAVSKVGESSILEEDLLNCLADPARMAEGAALARQRVDHHYSARIMAELYLTAYRRVRADTTST